LLEVSKLADKYGVEPPELVKLEQKTKIAWQDLIKLSMKSEGTKKVMSVSDISDTVNTLHKQATQTNLTAEDTARAMHHMAEDVMTIHRQLSVMKKWKAFALKKAEADKDEVGPSNSETVEVIEITEEDIDDEPIFVEEDYISNVESQPFSSYEGVEPDDEEEEGSSFEGVELEGPGSDHEEEHEFQLEAQPELSESEEDDSEIEHLALGTLEPEANKQAEPTPAESDADVNLLLEQSSQDEDISDEDEPCVDVVWGASSHLESSAPAQLSEPELISEEVSVVSEDALSDVEVPEVCMGDVSVVESSAPVVSDGGEGVVSDGEEEEEEEEVGMEESDLPEEIPGITVSADFISKDKEEMVPAAASEDTPEESLDLTSSTNSQLVQEPTVTEDVFSTTNSQAVRSDNEKSTMTERILVVEQIQIVKVLICYFYILWKYF